MLARVDADLAKARRLLSLAEEALARADEMRRAVDALLAEIGGPREVAPAPLDTCVDAARLVAIEMAVAGRSREDAGRHIRDHYEIADVEALLDDVFGAPALTVHAAPVPGTAAS